MKKVIFAIAIGLTIAANADYIYWMVDSNPMEVVDWDGQTKVSSTWTQANLYYNGSLIDSMSSTDWEDLSDIGAYAYSSFTSTMPDQTGTFMIELIGGAKYGKTTELESNLAQYIFSSSTPMAVMPTSAFGQGATYAVPEPTSGLLFLIGGMLLGLKRRRQEV